MSKALSENFFFFFFFFLLLFFFFFFFFRLTPPPPPPDNINNGINNFNNNNLQSADGGLLLAQNRMPGYRAEPFAAGRRRHFALTVLNTVLLAAERAKLPALGPSLWSHVFSFLSRRNICHTLIQA